MLDNSGFLLGAVDFVTHLVELSHFHTREGDISDKGDTDDANGSMESENLKKE